MAEATPVRTAAFFDLDKTIIATTSSMAFSRPFLKGGLITRSDALRTAYAQFLFMVGGADARQTTRLRDSLSELIKGWEVAEVTRLVHETVHELIDPVVYQEAITLIRRHQANGRDVVIVSASGHELVEPIATMLGADHVIASKMEIKKGFYTGTIDFYAYGERKAEAMRKLAEERGYDLERSYAYSDSITDLPMLTAVGHGFAVNPDRGMRKAAAEYGWGVLRFKKPMALRKGVAANSALISVALVIAAAAVALWIYKSSQEQRR